MNNLLTKTNNTKFYENILFEKNVYLSACKYFKDFKKIFIITSPTPKKIYLQHLINTLNEQNIKYYVVTVSKSQLCHPETILSICSKIQDHDLIVAFGAGKITDIAKIVSCQLSLPYSVIPTTISHYGLFNNVAYVLDNIPKVVCTNYPEKVFIDLDIVKKSPEQFILSTISFAVSLVEKLFVLEVNDTILQEKHIDISALTKKIKKIAELLNWVSLSKDFALLNLMDYIIDLHEICKNNFESNSISYSLTFSSSALKNNFGKKCLVSSSILLNLYSVLFNLKHINVQEIPNYEQKIKDLSKRKENRFFFDNYIQKTAPLINHAVIQSLNNSKNELSNYLTELVKFLKKFAKKLNFINNSFSKSVDQNELFSSLGILPFIRNDLFLNILCRYGLLNIS